MTRSVTPHMIPPQDRPQDRTFSGDRRRRRRCRSVQSRSLPDFVEPMLRSSLIAYLFTPLHSPLSPNPRRPCSLTYSLFRYTQSLLSQNSDPKTAQHFNQLLLQFMWEELSSLQLQAELKNLFTVNPYLRTLDLRASFDPILALSADSDAERAGVKKALCDRLGLITQKLALGRPLLEEGIQFQKDVEVGGDADRELLLLFLLFFCSHLLTSVVSIVSIHYSR